MLSCGIDDFLFQQDNSPVHKAYSVIDWLEANKIDIIEHPLYSPDLNPIEHIRVDLRSAYISSILGYLIHQEERSL